MEIPLALALLIPLATLPLTHCLSLLPLHATAGVLLRLMELQKDLRAPKLIAPLFCGGDSVSVGSFDSTGYAAINLFPVFVASATACVLLCLMELQKDLVVPKSIAPLFCGGDSVSVCSLFC